MDKASIDLRLPEAWKLTAIRTFGSRPAIMVLAFSARNWTAGIEIIRGYGNGVALVVGPFWLGIAIARKGAAHG